MIKKVFKKLVRDKIPEILKEKKILTNIRVLDNEEYLTELKKKLQEEVNEFLGAKDDEEFIAELTDILEVVEYLSLIKNTGWNKLMEKKNEKKIKRGGFEKKLFLEYTEE